MLKCFPVKSLKHILHQISSMRTGVIHAKGWFHLTAFQGVLTLWRIAVSAMCLHSASHWLWLHALGSWQAESPCSRRRRSSCLYLYSYGQLWISWAGRIEVFPLLALPFALGLKMVAPCFVPCDDMWQKHILFLMVLLQMTQTCNHSVNLLSLHQLMQNPLHANFSVLQVIFDNGMHGAVANADLNTNLFFCDSSVFPAHTINPFNHIRHNGSMDLSRAQIILEWCASFAESLLSQGHNCQGHSVCHTQQTCDNKFQMFQHPQPPRNEPHLLFFACLHFQC